MQKYLSILTVVIFMVVAAPWQVGAQLCEAGLDEEFLLIENQAGYELFAEKYQPCEPAFLAVQKLAKPYLLARDWPGATAVFRKYRPGFPGLKERFDQIIALLTAPVEGLTLSNLGPGINTADGEFSPVLAADGKKLYFARDRGLPGEGEDVYVARQESGQWGGAENMGAPISSPRHEMPLAVAMGGTTLLLYGNYPESMGRGDIFSSDCSGICWSGLYHYPAPLNSPFFESDASFGANGKEILFVSERPGGVGEFHGKDEFYHGSYVGNTDIYVYVQNQNGGWEAINLGETINTPYGEYSPCLHPDGKTLYFSSDGHYGLGGLDVFKATRLNDSSWTQWSAPVNLGKEINGPYHDWGYKIDPAGGLAYFSAANKEQGYGGNDIYAITLPAAARPAAAVTVFGRVVDPAGQPLAAVLRWHDLTRNRPGGEVASQPPTGEYLITLPAGRQYGYYAERDGYLGRSEQLDFSDIREYTEYKLDIVLYPVEKLLAAKTPIRLNNILFDWDKSDLRPESSFELKRWLDFFGKNPGIRAEIHGHTDSTGPESYNQGLSERRVQAVVDYLVKNGLARERLTGKGFGESRPVAANTTGEGRQLNRRVEILLLE